MSTSFSSTHKTPDRARTDELIIAISRLAQAKEFVPPASKYDICQVYILILKVTPRPARRRYPCFRGSLPAKLKGNHRSESPVPYVDPALYSYGGLPPMLCSSNQSGIHPVDSIDIQAPSSLASQAHSKNHDRPWDSQFIASGSPGDTCKPAIVAWDSTVRNTSVGLWRPPERHRVI